MRIAIVTGPFLPAPPAPCGAVERIWHELAGEFATRGHQVTVLCRGHEDQSPNETIHAIRFIRRTRFKRSRRLWWDLVRDLLYSCRMLPLVPPSDIVVTNSFWLPILLPLLRRRVGKIVVNVARMPKGQIGWYRRVDRLAAVSNAVRQEITLQCPDAAPLTKVIPNPIDTDIFAPSDRVFRSRRPHVILYAGRIHPEKGIDLLLRGFRRLHDLRQDVVLRILGPAAIEQGGGGREYMARLRGLAAGLPVEFLPPTFNKIELVETYRASSLFCYPSLAEQGESFGLAPLEAMATGLVPVVSDLSCFQDFVQDGRTGVVFDHRAPDAPDHLAAAFGRLLDDPEAYARMSAAGVRLAQDFSKERIAAFYLKDFEELLSNHS